MDVQTGSGLLVIFLQFGLYRHSTPTKHTHTHTHTHTHIYKYISTCYVDCAAAGAWR